jgi:hypothetical protein
MATPRPEVPAQVASDHPDNALRERLALLAEKLVDSPRLDADIDPELVPLGKDRGMLIRFVVIDLMLAGAVAGAAVLDHTWLLAPLMALLFLTLLLFVGMINQLLADPVG